LFFFLFSLCLSLFFSFFSQDWRNALLQVSNGNNTIYPTPRLRDYLKLVVHPSAADMQHYIRGGELVAWPRIHMLYNHFIVERVLTNALVALESTDSGRRIVLNESF
jgi:hypothetical protein